MSTATIPSATGKITAELSEIVRSLKLGQRIQIVQTVRVGSRKWPATATGVYRGLNYLATGVTTDRVPDDDIVVPILHFTKDNGELSSVALDENTAVTVLG